MLISLQKHFRNCTSIKSLCITLYIGSRVTNIIPIMESIAGLPKLEYIRLVMVAFNQTPFNQLDAGGMQDNLVSLLSMLQGLNTEVGSPQAPGVGLHYAEDSLRVLQTSSSLTGLEMTVGDDRYFESKVEITNCKSLNSNI